MAGFNHPELDRGDGACINLTKDNLCSIYETRPDFCRLNPLRPEEEQTKWCKLMEANWPTYLKMLQGVDTNPPGVVHSPGIEKEEG